MLFIFNRLSANDIHKGTESPLCPLGPKSPHCQVPATNTTIPPPQHQNMSQRSGGSHQCSISSDSGCWSTRRLWRYGFPQLPDLALARAAWWGSAADCWAVSSAGPPVPQIGWARAATPGAIGPAPDVYLTCGAPWPAGLPK